MNIDENVLLDFLGAELPEAYRKFWNEWKMHEPAAVHFVPKQGTFERNELTGEVHPIQNVKIPMQAVVEENLGLWGGEGVIKGFTKKKLLSHRVPHYWIPTLKRSAVRSEVLNEFFSLTVTDRTIVLINEHHGFDHYLLKSPACDLRSTLALKIKRRILKNLLDNCPAWQNNPTRQQDLMKEYGKYLAQYTPEEIDWYGLTVLEALRKMRRQQEAENPIVPHKIIFRQKLIEQLREAGIEAAQSESTEESSSSSWMKKLNPFSKKEF
jgi:large subunit ribosomal protein L28